MQFKAANGAFDIKNQRPISKISNLECKLVTKVRNLQQFMKAQELEPLLGDFELFSSTLVDSFVYKS